MSSRTSIFKLLRATRSSSAFSVKPTLRPSPFNLRSTLLPALLFPSPSTPVRAFSSTPIAQKGLSPESENPTPTPKPAEPTPSPANITQEQYEALSDEYMEAIVEKLEQLQEEQETIDVEYSSGVLNLEFPPAGKYVINKQPPNKQIWLSSPISGPKRYDFVIQSEGQEHKEGTGSGEWVYLRDGSTLADLLETELGIDIHEESLYAPVPHLDE